MYDRRMDAHEWGRAFIDISHAPDSLARGWRGLLPWPFHDEIPEASRIGHR